MKRETSLQWNLTLAKEPEKYFWRKAKALCERTWKDEDWICCGGRRKVEKEKSEFQIEHIPWTEAWSRKTVALRKSEKVWCGRSIDYNWMGHRLRVINNYWKQAGVYSKDTGNHVFQQGNNLIIFMCIGIILTEITLFGEWGRRLWVWSHAFHYHSRQKYKWQWFRLGNRMEKIASLRGLIKWESEGEENIKDNSDYIWPKNIRNEGLWLTAIIFSFFPRHIMMTVLCGFGD